MPDLIEQKLNKLGYTLPKAPAPVANYVPWVKSGNHLYISGQISIANDGEIIAGRIGSGLDVELGQKAAVASALNVLAQIRAGLGSLDAITQIVKLTGYVASTHEFLDHPKVINGASDLMVEVLGDKGRHTRAAVGVASLPLGAAVEIDAIVEF